MQRHPDFLPFFFLVLLLLAPLPTWGEVSVLTQHNDNSRSGANLNETILNTSNVNAKQFGKLFSRPVDGQIYAQPLYVPNVSIPSQGTHNVVYVATMHNTVYAFDADDPDASAPLWQRNLGPSVPWQDTGAMAADINGEIGITSTPVIDTSNGTIYLVAKSKENNTYFQRLHALDITTGQPMLASPVAIEASVAGTGDGSVDGIINFNPLKQLNRPGLLMLNGVIYIAFGGHADSDPYHGWVLGYDATTLQEVAVYNTTPNGQRGGIWQSGRGLVVDADGFIYLITGNGTFSYNTGGKDLGDSFVKLSTSGGLTVIDWFTPHDQDYLNEFDLDLGSTGPLLLPGTHLIVGGGKGRVLYLLDTNNLGHFRAEGDSQIVQSFQATAGLIHGSPVFWNSPDNGPLVYVWSENDSLKAFKLLNGRLQTTPFSTSTMTLPNSLPGAILSLSANGSSTGSGVIWASHPQNASAHHASVAGVLRAFDASDVSKELWNSEQNGTCDKPGSFAKFSPPTIANGKVYLATFSNQLVVYGLLKGSPPSPILTSVVLSSSGLNNSFFTSELTLINRGSEDAILDFTYTAAFGGGSGSASDALPAGQQHIVPDAVAYLRSLGIPIPASGNRGGTLAVRFSGLSSCSDGAVTVRTTTPVAEGRTGLAYTGIATSSALTGTSYLCGLRQNSSDRSNVAIQNVGSQADGDIGLRLTVFSGEKGAPFQQTLPDQKLSPGGFLQFSGILQSYGLSLTNGYVRVERISGTAPYYAYAVINDQTNSDGSFVPAIPENELAGRRGLILPVIVETEFFTSDLVITNWSTSSKTVRFAFLADTIQDAGKTADFVMTLDPGEQSYLENVIQVLRNQGVPGIGPVGPAHSGALFATVDGEDASGIFLGARTFSSGHNGRYSLYYTGVPYGTASATSAWLYGLQQNTENRSNLALVNTGEIDGNPDIFSIDLFDGKTGLKVNTIEGITLAPKRWMQINSILAQYAHGATQGYAQVRRTSGSNPFIAYAVVNDGAEPGLRSGDGAFISSSP